MTIGGEVDSEKNKSSNILSSKNSIKDIQDKVKLLILNARIFDKALKTLTGKTELFLTFFHILIHSFFRF